MVTARQSSFSTSDVEFWLLLAMRTYIECNEAFHFFFFEIYYAKRYLKFQ